MYNSCYIRLYDILFHTPVSETMLGDSADLTGTIGFSDQSVAQALYDDYSPLTFDIF